MSINSTVFTIFDFETTGLFPYAGDKICEIGAVRYSQGKILSKFHTLVNPKRNISFGAYMVNRISDDMIRHAPEIEEVIPKFMDFLTDSVLVAYNAGFDVGFLDVALNRRNHIANNFKVIDALKLARTLIKNVPSYNLGRLAKSLNIKVLIEHRAMSDTLMTLEIFKHELSLLEAKGVTDIDHILYTNPRTAERAFSIINHRHKIIEDAIRDERNLDITYLSSWTNKISERIITPLHLRKGYSDDYLVGYCHEKKEKRNFKIDGILKLKLLENNESTNNRRV